MTTIYGKPAVEVEQPGTGELVAYLVAPAAPTGGEQRAWTVTSPAGSEYRVSRYAEGFRCTCPAWRFNRYGAGRWCKVGERAVCKHVAGVLQSLEQGAK